jgi:hypothetical protein
MANGAAKKLKRRCKMGIAVKKAESSMARLCAVTSRRTAMTTTA